MISACTGKSSLPELEQLPYRNVVEYTPASYTVEVPGKVTPDADYDWISVAQTGDDAVFTLRRNTWDKIRRAEFSISGTKDKVVFSQKGHALDALLDASLVSQEPGNAEVSFMLSTDFYDDYESWGLILGTTPNPDEGTIIPQEGRPELGYNAGSVTGLKDGVDYFVWAYVGSTEGNSVVSNLVAILPPIYVRAGEDLQAAIDGCKEYSTIMVQGGCTFPGGIMMGDSNKNKTLSGGWDADFKEQSMDHLTVINGGGKAPGFLCAANMQDEPLQGYVNISYFEITNCDGKHGMAVHVCGGPVTVQNCYVHDNTGEKGAIGTREEDFSSTLNVVNCIIEANVADGHGAAFGLGDGASYDDQVQATIVSNLIINNNSKAFGGYCSVFICYNNTDLVFANNTVVGNLNYFDGGDEYAGMKFRGNVRNLLVNNIMVGNRISPDRLDPPVYQPFQWFLDMGGTKGTAANNIIESQIGGADNATLKDNTILPSGADYSNVITSDYKPTGISLGYGTIATLQYMENRDSAPKSCNLKSLFGKYSKDLAGNPRVVNGKIDAGCYQAQ